MLMKREVISLYKAVGIKPKREEYCDANELVDHCFCKRTLEYFNCDVCVSHRLEVKYPPFTAEKQIELIAFLVNKGATVEFSKEDKPITPDSIAASLAGIILKVFETFTQEEKQQLYEILIKDEDDE